MEKTIELLNAAGQAHRASLAQFDVVRDARVRNGLLRAMTESHPQPARSFGAILQTGLQQLFALRPAFALVALFVFVAGVSVPLRSNDPASEDLNDPSLISFAPTLLTAGSGMSDQMIAEAQARRAAMASEQTFLSQAPVKRLASRAPAKSIAYAPSVGNAFAPSVIVDGHTFAKSIE